MSQRWRFDAGRRGLRSVLGPLETQILEALWRLGEPAEVAEVRAALPDDPAYTTVKTVLERLTEKGLVARHRAGRAYRYQAAHTRDDLEADVTHRVSRGLLDGFGSAALTHFVDAVREDPEQLETLRAMLDQLGRQEGREEGEP